MKAETENSVPIMRPMQRVVAIPRKVVIVQLLRMRRREELY